MNVINTESSNGGTADSSLETIRSQLSKLASSIEETYCDMLMHVVLNVGFDMNAADKTRATVLLHMKALEGLGEWIGVRMDKGASRSTIVLLLSFTRGNENCQAARGEMDVMNVMLSSLPRTLPETLTIELVMLTGILSHLRRACDCLKVVVDS